MDLNNSIIYLPHGGGPMPLLGEPSQQGLITFLESCANLITKPTAIVVISAHWESARPTVTSASTPALIYDYYGFPREAYDIQYAAPGEPSLAEDIYQCLLSDGLDAVKDGERGFDHGMFVPLKLMYPEATIPCVQVSLIKGLDPELHLKLGRALARLPQQNILVVGSGMSFHNLNVLMSPRLQEPAKGEVFAKWLVETMTAAHIPDEERLARLAQWSQAPGSAYSHPREEHLLPLHVCMGVAMALGRQAKIIFDETLMRHRVLGFLW